MIFTALRRKPRPHPSLTGELAWTLIIKSIALFIIWLAFFSSPVHHSSVEAYLHQKLFNPPAALGDQWERNSGR